MKIVCDNKIPFLRGVFEPFAEVVYLPGKETTPEVVRDADAVITRTRTKCDAALLAGSSVKVIATATIGYDHIDTAWCESNGILWRNAPGCNSWSVKQYIAAVLCTLARRHGLNLAELTLGVVGVGHVGSKVAEVASLLGMKVLLCDPPRARALPSLPAALSSLPAATGNPFVSLDTICRESDIITLHVPLTREGEDATWHLFDAQRIASLRPDQFLLNSSRGPVVDNAALKAALQAKRLRGAVLDVWEGEPEPDRELMGLLDIATPHIAGYSADGKANGTTASVHTVASVLGLPLADWAPAGIPAPAQPLDFTLNARGKSHQEVLSEAILYTYDILADDRALRANPDRFEQLRGDYPVRREPTAFTLQLQGGTPELAETLAAIGFNVTTN
ncbi:MAG: 4-phosphoerythronate dehydrogenase PdxB [Bacteroidales bacterium]|nr:4-phosphoerythronate dehydrogenase PdxB [Bacteroidales bacterium]